MHLYKCSYFFSGFLLIFFDNSFLPLFLFSCSLLVVVLSQNMCLRLFTMAFFLWKRKKISSQNCCKEWLQKCVISQHSEVGAVDRNLDLERKECINSVPVLINHVTYAYIPIPRSKALKLAFSPWTARICTCTTHSIMCFVKPLYLRSDFLVLALILYCGVRYHATFSWAKPVEKERKSAQLLYPYQLFLLLLAISSEVLEANICD